VSTAIEAESIGELIADCDEIPTTLRMETAAALPSVSALPWTVDEACHAQVAELDVFV